MKKFLSVALALVMIVSCFSLMANAVTTNALLEITVTPKEASYKKGDVVTFEVFYERSDVLEDAGHPMFIAFGYDSSVFETVQDVSYGPNLDQASETIITKGYAFEGGLTNPASSVITAPTESGSEDNKNGWDTHLRLATAGEPEITYKPCDTKTAMFAFNLRLKEDANPSGNYTVGVARDSVNPKDIDLLLTINESGGGISGSSPADLGIETDIAKVFSFVDGTVKVDAPAPAGPAVTKAKSQVKMTATSATTVDDEFSFRVISKISDSDWDTYFKNTGVADARTDYITAVGMVAYKGAAAFDAETAKRVVAGESVADYTAATTNYISKVSNTADAEFGAIIKANHSTLKNDVTYMGFVQYVDASGNAQTIFYETAGTAALSTNYNNIVSAYLARYPFAA